MYKILLVFWGLLCLIAALPLSTPALARLGSRSPIDDYNLAGPVHDHSKLLETRAPSAEFKAFLVQIHAAKQVDVGTSAFYTFAQEPAIASAGFDGCIGSMIVGTEGAIVSHYTVTASDMKTAQKDIPKLWSAHKSGLGGEPKVIVYANVQPNNHNEYVQPAIANEFIGLIKTTTGVTPTVEKYLQMGDTCVDAAGDLLDGADYDHMQSGAIMVAKVKGTVKERWVTITQQKECVATLGVGSA
ncbi:hypothetical protein N0V93_000880 [Gnomoniopsis smithogilvyi]|uniref:Uncharacterized protein n=1 Tax=Gnomoniopsis smithogilvyi TaxID=1191159 RepID=A0A9W8Z4I2_9PEZI|nr:hypothetical protein N0V93_000880 [Gnomoniopsis smithogilvyi]